MFILKAGKIFRVRFRIDGRLSVTAIPSLSLRDVIGSRIKVMVRMDIAEKHLTQEGRIQYPHCMVKNAENYKHDVDNTMARLSTLLELFIMVVLGLLIGGLGWLCIFQFLNWTKWYDLGLHSPHVWPWLVVWQLCECTHPPIATHDQDLRCSRSARTALRPVLASVTLPTLRNTTQSLAQHPRAELLLAPRALRFLPASNQLAISVDRNRHRSHLAWMRLVLGL